MRNMLNDEIAPALFVQKRKNRRVNWQKKKKIPSAICANETKNERGVLWHGICLKNN